MDEIIEATGLSLQHLKEVEMDRRRWRELTHVVARGRERPDGTR